MFQNLLSSTKSRREYITKLYESLNAAVFGYGGAVITPTQNDQHLQIRLVKETMDLKRFLRLPSVTSYLLLNRHSADKPEYLRLNDVPADATGSTVLLQSTSPYSSKIQLRFRRGEKNEKDLFLEVWSDTSRGYLSSRKISEKCTKVYNDAVFGGVSWSRDERRIVFVGERPESASYKNYWEDAKQEEAAEEKKGEEAAAADGKEAEKKKEEEKPVTYLDEKYKYIDDFGETLVGKRRPALFVFDVVENTFNEVQGVDELYPTFPVFDESNQSIVFAGVKTPIQKFGMNYCLNRDTKLYFIKDPVFDKKKVPNDGTPYMKCLNSSEFMSINPKFSDDFSKLLYVGTKDRFISHTGNFQLRYLSWPITSVDQQSTLVIDKVSAYPTDQDIFAGLFGYNQTLISFNFLGKSNRFALFETPFKGQHRIYLVDLETKSLKWLNFLGKEPFHGDYELQRVYRDTAVIRFGATEIPTQIYAVQFKNTEGHSIEEVTYKITKLEEVQLDQKNPIEKEIAEFLPTISKETIKLENGAEGYIVYSKSPVFQDKKRPMIIIIHGGPFGCSPADMFYQMRTFLMMQGYALLIVNYRGSTGYGEDFLNSLLGNIGDRDVHDCGELIKLALSTHTDLLDPSKVICYGASHGGFLTGWLIGHPSYKDLFKAAVLWNPVLNMSYMYSSTDIPDWILACCLNKDWEHKVTSDDNKVFWDRSPISVVGNVKTPSLILIGGSDKRVPPHQGFQYHHILKEQGVKTKLYHYPEDGHAIAGSEPGMDALMNIFMWMDENLSQE